MFLSHQTIEKCLNNGSIKIEPEFNRKNIRPAGVRVHLGATILVPEPGQIVSLTKATHLKYKEVNISDEDFFLDPGSFVLGSTYELFQTSPKILALLDGRSTVARLGLTTHITASVIDGTFEKLQSVTLELKNLGNFTVQLKYKDPIAMMLFAELTDQVTQKLQSQYGDHSDKVAPPNLNFKTGQDI